MLAGGEVKGATGQSAIGGETVAANEALASSTVDHRKEADKETDEVRAEMAKERAMLGEANGGPRMAR